MKHLAGSQLLLCFTKMEKRSAGYGHRPWLAFNLCLSLTFFLEYSILFVRFTVKKVVTCIILDYMESGGSALGASRTIAMERCNLWASKSKCCLAVVNTEENVRQTWWGQRPICRWINLILQYQ
jgi:hypothetical protein